METLKSLGFTNDQVAIYDVLFEQGKLPASAIARKAKVSRVITYNILNYFTDIGIAEKIDIPKSVAVFSVTDPENLRKLVEAKKSQIQTLEATCESAISQLRPRFNLLTNKPGVTFYEGLEGVKKVLEDSLYTEDTIRTYLDLESSMKHITTINNEYARRREKLGIKKRIIVADTPGVKDFFKDRMKDYSGVRIVPEPVAGFGCGAQIYDDKVSFITIAENSYEIISVIIQDKRIANMQRYFFDALYDALPEQEIIFSN